MSKFEYDLCVVGGFGHVGLPLSINFANKGLKVIAFDISEETLKKISNGKMPFLDHGTEPIFGKTLKDGTLTLSLSPDSISKSENVLITIGTPTDLHMSPEPVVEQMAEEYLKYFVDGQLILLRSTVYPGTTERLHKLLKSRGKNVDVAFCPERIIQGHASRELLEVPHIVSATSKSGLERAKKLFGMLNSDIVELNPTEAELAKLFINAWRYITFSVANQFFMMAEDNGQDFYRIYDAMLHNYPRMKGFPKAGFASGPCLFKDTLHLNAYSINNFDVGNAAILVNESMPYYVIKKLKQKHDLKDKKVGILGMAFKADSDDGRDSLSYKLLKLLKYEAKEVYFTDPYVKEPGAAPLEKVLNDSDIIILATPHTDYANLKFDKDKVVVDVWNYYGNGSGLQNRKVS